MASVTSSTSLNALAAVELLKEGAIAASIPRAVMSSMVHFDNSLDGAKTDTLRIPVETDLGISAGGTEGVAPSPTPTVEATMGTSVSATTTKGVLDIIQVTEETFMNVLGVRASEIQHVLQNGTIEQFKALFARIIPRVTSRGVLKHESDLLSLLPSISGSAGDGAESFSAAVALEAIYTQRTQQPLRPTAMNKFLCAAEQTYEMDQEALVGSAYGSNLWVSQAQYKPSNGVVDPASELQGVRGSFLGFPVCEVDDELADANLLTNTNLTVNGAFGDFGTAGQSAADPNLQGKPGAFCFVQKAPLLWNFETDLETGTIKGRLTAHYDMIECAGQGVVKIATGHTA